MGQAQSRKALPEAKMFQNDPSDPSISIEKLAERNHLPKEWLREYDEAHQRKDWEKVRLLRQIIATQTARIAQQGSYRIGNSTGMDVQIKSSLVKFSREQTEEYKNTDQAMVQAIRSERATCRETQTFAEEMDTIECALQCAHGNLNPAVLLMTAGRLPLGHAWKSGYGAQEQNIFRRTTYHLAFHAKDRGIEPSRELGEFGVLYTPQVQVFRGSEAQGYPLLRRTFPISFVAASAYKLRDKVTRLHKDHAEGTKKKLRTLCFAALAHGHDSLVLSAFGCGTYKNPPGHMAELMREVLNEDLIRNRFRMVRFAIIDPQGENLAAFQKVFNTNRNTKPMMEAIANSPHLTSSEDLLSQVFQSIRYERDKQPDDDEETQLGDADGSGRSQISVPDMPSKDNQSGLFAPFMQPSKSFMVQAPSLNPQSSIEPGCDPNALSWWNGTCADNTDIELESAFEDAEDAAGADARDDAGERDADAHDAGAADAQGADFASGDLAEDRSADSDEALGGAMIGSPPNEPFQQQILEALSSGGKNQQIAGVLDLIARVVRENQEQRNNLQAQVFELLEVNQDRLLLRDLKAHFNDNQRLCFNTVRTSLEDFFISCKTVAGNMVDPKEGNLGVGGQGIQLLGQAVRLVPIVGNMLSAVPLGASHGLSYLSKHRQRNACVAISRLVSLNDIPYVCAHVAAVLTDAFQWQLERLDSAAALVASGSSSRVAIGKGLQKAQADILRAENKAMAVLLGEAMASLAIASLQGLPRERPRPDVIRLLSCAVLHHGGWSGTRTQLTESLRRTFSCVSLHATVQGARVRWKIADILALPGVLTTTNERFSGGNSNPELLGYIRACEQTAAHRSLSREDGAG